MAKLNNVLERDADGIVRDGNGAMMRPAGVRAMGRNEVLFVLSKLNPLLASVGFKPVMCSSPLSCGYEVWVNLPNGNNYRGMGEDAHMAALDLCRKLAARHEEILAKATSEADVVAWCEALSAVMDELSAEVDR